MTMDAWVKKYIGKAVDYDGVYGVQCVDLVKSFIKNVLGITPQSIGNAIEYYRKRNTSVYLKKNFTWYSYKRGFVPHRGDICVFTSKSGNGHVSIATGEGNDEYFYSFDENYPRGKHEPMTKIKHTYNSLLGVLRPKNQANIETKKPSASAEYYPRYTGKSGSIVDALEHLKIDSSYAHRKKIALANGIKDYKGTPEQNTRMLEWLKKGKLKKA